MLDIILPENIILPESFVFSEDFPSRYENEANNKTLTEKSRICLRYRKSIEKFLRKKAC
jgi:hypothetical protein